MPNFPEMLEMLVMLGMLEMPTATRPPVARRHSRHFTHIPHIEKTVLAPGPHLCHTFEGRTRNARLERLAPRMRSRLLHTVVQH